MYDKIAAERSNEINSLNCKTEYDKLMYNFKNEDRTQSCFNDFNCPLGLVRKIKDGSMDLKKAQKR